MKESELERLLKALANRRRLSILKHLRARKEVNVSTIAEVIKLSFSSTSKHLRLLENAGFVEKEQRGLEMYYRIPDDAPLLVPQVLKHL